MAIRDFRRLDDGPDLQADVCIVGSGPAGWTLADELRDSGLTVLVLESGGVLESGLDPHAFDPEAEALNATVDTGQPYSNGRRRTLGGSPEASVWANRTTTFDPIDYEARPWVPHSGWPIGPHDVEPYLPRAAVHLGIGVPTPQAPRLPRGATWPPLDPAQLSPVTWVFGQGEDRRALRYARHFRWGSREGLRVLVHATVTQILTNATGTVVEGVEISSPAGRRGRVAARAVVLAAGGIENPRILLTSTRTVAAGLGNGRGLVGRFLMDHPRDLSMTVTFDPAGVDRLRAMFGTFRLDFGGGLRYCANGLSLSPERQRSDGLLNCAAWFYEETADDDPVQAAKRLVRGRGDWRRDGASVVANAGALLRATHARLLGDHVLHSKPRKVGLFIGSEQLPDPESRVTLADSVDCFGLPLARTHWRINDLDRATQAALALTIGSEFRRIGFPPAILADWVRRGALDEAPLVDGCHPTGTTKMSEDPGQGVVDKTSQVHGVQGLYVAGSSVFPTASHANPTLMIAAMAVRLADHLAQALASREAVVRVETILPPTPTSVPSLPAVQPAAWSGETVAVTGASGFLGERLVERLVERGATVVSLSRRPAGGRVLELPVETRVVDLADAPAVETALRGVGTLFHCAYDWADDDWNRRALASLLAAARTLPIRRVVHVSSIVVYDLPMAGALDETCIETTARSGYPRVKADLDAMVESAVRDAGVAATIIQPTLVYGPRSQPWTLDPIDKLTRGRVILPDAGEGACNAVYVDDVVEAMLLAARAPGAVGERFLVSGEPVRWRDFYGALAKIAGVPGPTFWPRRTILEKNRTLKRAIRGLTTPRLLARKLAAVGPVRKGLAAGLKSLPESMRAGVEEQLYGPIARLRGHTHLPSPGELQFLETRAVVDVGKAQRILGYVPRVRLPEGMAEIGEAIRLNGARR